MPEKNTKSSVLKLKKNYYEAQPPPAQAVPEEQAASEADASSAATPFHRKVDTSHKLRQNIRIAAGWLLFLLLGGGLFYLRFFSAIPGLDPVLLKQYGMLAVGITYIVAILLALKDNMFDGLLAIVVPFYPVYYLFSGCGSVFLRAIAAALLAAFGYDTLMLIQAYALKVYEKLSYMISHT